MFNMNTEKVAAMHAHSQSGSDPQTNNLMTNHEFDGFRPIPPYSALFRPIPPYSAILWKIK